MGLKENGTRTNGVTLMGRDTRASWNQNDVCGRGIGNRIMFGMYVSRPVGYYEKAMILPFSYGGAAVRLAGTSSTSNTIEAIGSLSTDATINGLGTPVFNGNEGWHIFADLDGEGFFDTANIDDSRGSLEWVLEIGSRPSAYDIAQAVLNATAATYNNAGTIGEKISAEVPATTAIADAVWDEILLTHTTPGCVAVRLKKLLDANKFIGLK